MTKLVCFPFAGAGSTIYNKWQTAFSNKVAVLPVELPGRGSRFGEETFTNVPELARLVVTENLANFRAPCALFGHSFGALIAFEVAHLLSERQLYPVHVFVSASRAPHATPRNVFHSLARPELLARLVSLNGFPSEILHERDLIDLVLPRIRADLKAAETYIVRKSRLTMPITAFGGVEDVFVTESELAAWECCTREAFSVKMFPGHHFFLQSRVGELSASIEAMLAGSASLDRNAL